jgi:hypothetical protein
MTDVKRAGLEKLLETKAEVCQPFVPLLAFLNPTSVT